MYPPTKVAEALALSSEGLNDYAVAERVGVSRATVQNWRLHGGPGAPAPSGAWVPSGASYAYLLGQYLGDGHISVRSERAAVLAITVSDDYPKIAREVEESLAAVFPGARIRRRSRRHSACSVLAVSTAAATLAFPQHGRGRKHERKIELVAWQRALTHGNPGAFVRGLIHSDGCRCINRFKTRLPSARVAEYEYVRYFFTNYSPDIRRIFREHCELLGIRCTRSSARNISISRRSDVRLLDEIVGAKA